jgi:hypothetical protein
MGLWRGQVHRSPQTVTEGLLGTVGCARSGLSELVGERMVLFWTAHAGPAGALQGMRSRRYRWMRKVRQQRIE